MNATDTEQGTEDDILPAPQCAICGVTVVLDPYALNTCSQDCARTAAIVEAIGKLTTVMELRFTPAKLQYVLDSTLDPVHYDTT